MSRICFPDVKMVRAWATEHNNNFCDVNSHGQPWAFNWQCVFRILREEIFYFYSTSMNNLYLTFYHHYFKIFIYKTVHSKQYIHVFLIHSCPIFKS